MAAIIYIVLAVLVHAALPAGQYFDCTGINNEPACIATKYCLWNAPATTANCIYDTCLNYVAEVGDADSEACTTTEGCGLYYITDIHNCTNGAVIEQTDVFCRTDNKTNVGLHKLPLDECFYQDFKNKETDGTAKCSNVGTIGCRTVGSGNTSYCEPTGTQTCNNYLEDNDLAGFCGCLGPDRCNLYPGCTIKGSACVDDPCYYGEASPGGNQCVGNIPNKENCGVKNVQKVNAAGVLVSSAICVTVTANNNVKVNDYNPCYYGIIANLSYPSWATNSDLQYPECATVNEVDKCAEIIYSGEKNCSVADIASGWFLGAQGHYCTDDQKRNIPSPSSSSILRIPSILFFVAVALVALL